MKKNYIKPTTKVVQVKQRTHLLQASGIQNFGNNVNLKLKGASNVAGRSREAEFDDGEWFDEE